MQLARFLFATNSAFRIIEHPEFVKFVNMLRSSNNLPSRQAVGTTLLDRVFLEEQKVAAARLDGKTVCMSMDGWINVLLVAKLWTSLSSC
jgi:hypothetical protein